MTVWDGKSFEEQLEKVREKIRRILIWDVFKRYGCVVPDGDEARLGPLTVKRPALRESTPSR